MSSSLCVLPGCSGNRATQRGLHLVTLSLYPRENKEWKMKLLEFCCKYRDRRAVFQAARRDSAVLCERHFTKDDIFFHKGKKKIIPGRMPTLNLPELVADRSPSTAQEGNGSKCVAYGCNKRRKRSLKVVVQPRSDSEGSEDEESEEKRQRTRTFHLFPSDPILFRKWLINIRRKDWLPDSKSVICSDHFKEKDIVRCEISARLKLGAIPTRFKCYKPQFEGSHLKTSDSMSSGGKTSFQ